MWDLWRRHRARALRAIGAFGLTVFGWLAGTALPSQAAGNAQVGVSVYILNPPNAVTDLVASPVGLPNEVQLVWTAPANPNGAAVTHYLVRVASFPAANTGQAEAWWSSLASSERYISPAHAPGIPEFTSISGLTTGVTQYFGIKSVDVDNQISAIDSRVGTLLQANSLPVNGAPPTPTGFTGVALSTFSVKWQWTASAGATFYTVNVFPGGALIGTSASTSLVESGLTANSPNNRTVSAVNVNGSSPASGAITTYTLADVPTGLTSLRTGFNDVDLTWSGASNPAGTQFRLERSIDGTSYISVGLFTALAHTDAGLAEGTTYFYRVLGINGDGVSSVPSSTTTIVTGRRGDTLAPASVLGFTGQLDDQGHAFTLSWEPVVRNADGTLINDLVGYNVYRSTALGSVGAKLTPVPISLTAFADLVNGATLYYSVRAVDTSANESADSFVVDSSRDENVIFLAADGHTNVIVPSDINELLRSSNKYGVPLKIELVEEPAPSNTEIVRNVRFVLLRGDTGLPVSDLAFARANATLALGYNEVNGQIAHGAPLSYAAENVTIANATPNDLSIFFNNGVTWVKVGGTPDLGNRTVRTQTGFLGGYQLRIAPQATALSLDNANVFPRLITPNDDGLNDRVYFVLENPNNASVRGEILDAEGRLVATLPPPATTGGVGTTLVWDGRDSSGHVVRGGAYLYRIEGEGHTFTGTVGVAR